MSVAIIPYEPHHAADWARLNEGWLIEGGFVIEAKDRKVIDDPRGAILDPGGRIFMAERDGQAIGCCALMAMDDGGFEVAKMCVTPAAASFRSSPEKPGLPLKKGSMRIFDFAVSRRKAEWPSQVIFIETLPSQFCSRRNIWHSTTHDHFDH